MDFIFGNTFGGGVYNENLHRLLFRASPRVENRGCTAMLGPIDKAFNTSRRVGSAEPKKCCSCLVCKLACPRLLAGPVPAVVAL